MEGTADGEATARIEMLAEAAGALAQVHQMKESGK